MRGSSRPDVRLYSWFLGLLPRSFQEEYGDEMRATVGEHWAEVRDNGGWGARMRFWWRQGASLSALALRLRSDTKNRNEGGWGMLNGLGQDLRYGLRGMFRRPGFALVTVVTLGLGIGASTAIFSAVNAVLLRELPYTEPDRVVTVFQTNLETGSRSDGISAANLQDVRDATRRLEHVAVAEPWGLDLQLEDRAANLRTWAVSKGFFEALGAAPVLGRAFAPDEYEDGKDRVILLGYRSWSTRFGADPAIVGETLIMEGQPYTVIGVLPPTFKFPDEAEVWMPRADRPWDAQSRAADYHIGVARLAPGATIAEARAEVDGIAASLAESFPDVNEGVGIGIVPLREHLFGDVRTPLLILLGSVGFVLLIACANVAGLLLARGRQRSREYALRCALGAGTARIVRQVVVEGILLAGLGCGLGVLLAMGGVQVIQSLGPDHLPRIDELRIDGVVLAFAVGVTGLSAVLAGLAPAFQLATPELRDALSEGSRGATTGRRSNALRSRLVVAEVALAMVLLIGAGLLLKSFTQLLGRDLGFNPSDRLALQVFAYGYEGSGRSDFVNQAVEGIRALPGVVDVAITTWVPGATDATIAGIDMNIPFTVVDQAAPLAGQEPIGSLIQVTAGYFDILDIPVVDGREFERTDDQRAPPVVIINEALARRHFGDGRAVGERLAVTFGDTIPTVREIVGVVRDVRQLGYESVARPEFYISLSQVGSGSLTFIIEAEHDAASLANPAREAVWSANRAQAIWGAATLDQLLAERLKERRFNLYLISSFAMIALLLSAVGVYGLVSFSVERRVAELGVRRALGGRAGDIVAMVIREGVVLAGVGIALGVVGALLLTRFLQAMLLDVEATDPATFLLLSAVVLVVTLLATLLPALRAMRVDPVVALRAE